MLVEVVFITQILLVKGTLFESSNKTHISYSFYIENISHLYFKLDFNPKTLEDKQKAKTMIYDCLLKYSNLAEEETWEKYFPLKNLLTLSVDDPKNFRGAAHRQPTDEALLIAYENSSAGFLDGEMINGYWKITISVHSIVTDSCDYELQIWTEG